MSRGARMVRKGARAAVVYCAPLGAETSRGAMFSSLMKPTTLSTMYGIIFFEVHSVGGPPPYVLLVFAAEPEVSLLLNFRSPHILLYRVFSERG